MFSGFFSLKVWVEKAILSEYIPNHYFLRTSKVRTSDSLNIKSKKLKYAENRVWPYVLWFYRYHTVWFIQMLNAEYFEISLWLPTWSSQKCFRLRIFALEHLKINVVRFQPRFGQGHRSKLVTPISLLYLNSLPVRFWYFTKNCTFLKGYTNGF